MSDNDEVIPVDLDAIVPTGDSCPTCGRSPARHRNPSGRRWTCTEIQQIEASCAYWSLPWWRRTLLRLRGRGPV